MFLADIIIQRLSRVKPLGPAPLKGWKASNGSKDMHRPFGVHTCFKYIYIQISMCYLSSHATYDVLVWSTVV